MRAALLALTAFLSLVALHGPAFAAAPAAPQTAEVTKPAPENQFNQLAQLDEDPVELELIEQYSRWVTGFTQRSWEWHLLSTKIIFFVVIFIVLFGMFVSWLQFRHDLSSKPTPTETSDGAVYDVSASLQSVSVKSKTIGAVVLLASTGFLLMYLIYVYPMHEADRAVAQHLPSTGD